MSGPDFERAMRTLAATAGSRTPLPDADAVWELAAAREQWKLRELATRPIRLAEGAAFATCGAVGVLVFLALLPGLEAALRAADQTWVRLGGITLALAAATALACVKALFAEE